MTGSHASSNEYLYRAYGLVIGSDVQIPDLHQLATPATVDVRVLTIDAPAWLSEAERGSRTPWSSVANASDTTRQMWKIDSGEYAYIAYPDDTAFYMSIPRSEIWTTWPEPLTTADMATYLLGPIMGFVLALKGLTSLHASSLSVDGRAFTIVGPAGSGKSTTAAALSMRGIAVLSEDVTALTEVDGSFFVEPGYPTIRLWPASTEVLGKPRESFPLITPNWEKRRLPLGTNRNPFEEERTLLESIYFLEERITSDDAPRIVPAIAGNAFISLVRNTYANYLLDKTMRAREFETLSRLSAKVAMRRVIPSADPSRLPLMCDLILDDFARSAASESMAN